ncbi:hypothetical protein [Nocardia noduli]|nr:hypothetical protein [Nocardia noduli]
MSLGVDDASDDLATSASRFLTVAVTGDHKVGWRVAAYGRPGSAVQNSMP